MDYEMHSLVISLFAVSVSLTSILFSVIFKTEDNVVSFKAAKALFVALLFTYSEHVENSNHSWNKACWLNQQLVIAKYFPKQAMQFAILLSIPIDNEVNRLLVVRTTAKLARTVQSTRTLELLPLPQCCKRLIRFLTK